MNAHDGEHKAILRRKKKASGRLSDLIETVTTEYDTIRDAILTRARMDGILIIISMKVSRMYTGNGASSESWRVLN